MYFPMALSTSFQYYSRFGQCNFLDIDEDELDEELAELQQEKLDEQMLNTGNVPIHDAPSSQKLPQAPNTNIKAPQRVEEDDEEEELRKLQAEMAM